jgi:hypothetical protein
MKKTKKILTVLVISIFTIFAILLFFLMNDDNNSSNSLYKVKGIWIADGTQYTYIVGYKDGHYIYSDNSTPFSLNLDGKGNYTLEMGENTEIGTYSFNQGNVVLQNEDGLITENCQIKNNNELHCDKYASLYIKK